MNIVIGKDTTGPYPNPLHAHRSYMQTVIRQMEKIGIENIHQLDITCAHDLIRTQDDIQILSEAIIISRSNRGFDVKEILDPKQISKIQIWIKR